MGRPAFSPAPSFLRLPGVGGYAMRLPPPRRYAGSPSHGEEVSERPRNDVHLTVASYRLNGGTGGGEWAGVPSEI